MDLRTEILKEHSKQQCRLIVQWVGNSAERFAQLFHLFLQGENLVVQRAAWPLSYCVEAHPNLILPHLGKLLKYLQQPGLHNTVKRNGTRLLQYVAIPQRYRGKVMHICFGFLESPKEAVAVKVFALTVLVHLARHHPEIVPEIKLLIEAQLPQQTAAFKSRVKNLMPVLSTIQ
ncbi:MAG TPA: hypothetical protein PKC39_12095 [Ferruginibacter sp.]|nr:hypothetical protein [Ferruginibacter sp.]HMP21691.1 hypothetical protein [Ferruginibacter sp.]